MADYALKKLVRTPTQLAQDTIKLWGKEALRCPDYAKYASAKERAAIEKLFWKKFGPQFQVRCISRGYWTYDLYNISPGSSPEFSVGECGSRKQARENAQAYIDSHVNKDWWMEQWCVCLRIFRRRALRYSHGSPA